MELALKAVSFCVHRHTYLVTSRYDSIRDFVLKDKMEQVLGVELMSLFSLIFEKD